MTTIAITGVGCISALGKGFERFSARLMDGHCGIGPIRAFDAKDFRCRIAAEVQDYDAAAEFRADELTYMDRFSQFAVLSAREAAAMSGLPLGEASERVAVVHATGVGGQCTQDEQYEKLYRQGSPRLRPTAVPKLSPSAGAALISMDLGIRGPAFATTSACASSGHAVAMGVAMLRTGMCDYVLVGGAEAPVTPGCVRGWEALRVLAHDTCRPFSDKRGGLVLGEGAATLVLEHLDRAVARGVRPLAVVAGCGLSSDASHYIQPSVDGPRRAIAAALHEAQLNPEDVHYVNAHGTGTGHNDAIESSALAAALGSSAMKTPVSSTKSMHGHTLGAATALELAAVLAAFHHQTLPPTMNYLGAAQDCPLDYIPNASRRARVDTALCNSLGFGGLNTCIALRRFT